jgi:ribonuclease HI
MAKKKPKFYVVWGGHNPGVYKTWPEAQKQIAGFSKARYKSFDSLAKAEKAFTEEAADHWGKSDKPKKPKTPKKKTMAELESMGVVLDSICVDAACKGNPGPLEYQGVELSSDINIFHQGPFENGTVNIGEFLAIVHALALLQAKRPDQAIYSDSRIGISWVKQKKCKTKLTQTVENKDLFLLVRRAEKWLRENEFSNPILKWETKHWGEIPADFGRK